MKKTYRGSCHCGAVRFEVQTPDTIEVEDCNCSMCARTGYLHIIVPAHRFRLISGMQHLASYSFNTGAAKHMFCSVCGIKSFYIPRSHPDGYSINFRCLDKTEFHSIITTEFDGRQWEDNAASLAPLEEA